MKDTAWEALQNSFLIEGEAVKEMLGILESETFEKALELLENAARIGASGCGHSGIACRHFAHLMCCIERPARFLSPAEAVHGGLGFLQKDDVILLASRGGKSEELLPILQVCKTKGIRVISVTENMDSPLAREADVVLRMKVTRETDRYNSQGTTSFVVLSALFDALQAALVEQTEYRNEQFAVIHPAGAVGKRLNQ